MSEGLLPPTAASIDAACIGRVVDGAAVSRKARAALPLRTVGAGMLVHHVRVEPEDVVFVKGLVEASEGLAGVFAERGGDLMLAAPRDREREIVAFLDDLRRDVHAVVTAPSDSPILRAEELGGPR